MKIALLVAAITAVVCLAWVGGEQHRANCITEHRSGCSILPWNSGTDAPLTPDAPTPRDSLKGLHP